MAAVLIGPITKTTTTFCLNFQCLCSLRRAKIKAESSSEMPLTGHHHKAEIFNF
jgi:hypothetical protein